MIAIALLSGIWIGTAFGYVAKKRNWPMIGMGAVLCVVGWAIFFADLAWGS